MSSAPSDKASPSSAKTPPSVYLREESIDYSCIPKSKPPTSYTNFIVDLIKGWWACPGCAVWLDVAPAYALEKRGYKKGADIVKAAKELGIELVIPKCYPTLKRSCGF